MLKKGAIVSINIPVKVNTRMIAGIKKYKPVLEKAKAKDVNESDTVTIITDMLCDVFGYDKYTEITSEYAIKKTFCDLAVKIEGTPRLLIEIKSAGMCLNENHVRQAAGYGSTSGIDWVILTNGSIWEVYKIIFGKPVDLELVYEFDFLEINTKKQSHMELLYYITKEAMSKESKLSLSEYHIQKQILNKITIGQILLSDPVLDVVRRTIKKLADDSNATNDEIKQIIAMEVIKREVLEDEKATELKRKIQKICKPAKKTGKKAVSSASPKIEIK